MDAKQKWKNLDRLRRMANRECGKAAMDLVTFGTGVVLVASNGESEHIPVESIIRKAEDDIKKASRVPADILMSGSYGVAENG